MVLFLVALLQSMLLAAKLQNMLLYEAEVNVAMLQNKPLLGQG